MDRISPTTDLFTLVGMMATIAGILVCLFFLFTPMTFGATETNVMHRTFVGLLHHYALDSADTGSGHRRRCADPAALH